MKTERTLELLKHFKDHGINHDPKNGNLDLIVEYQDCVMGANKGELCRFEAELDKNTRQQWFWVNSCTLGMDSFLDILRSTYITRVINHELDHMIDEQQSEWTAIHRAKETFRDCKKSIYKRIRKLTDRAEKLESSKNVFFAGYERLEKENARLRRENRMLDDKASRYDGIKRLLA